MAFLISVYEIWTGITIQQRSMIITEMICSNEDYDRPKQISMYMCTAYLPVYWICDDTLDIHLGGGNGSATSRIAAETMVFGIGHIDKFSGEIFCWYGCSAHTLHKESETVSSGAGKSWPATWSRQWQPGLTRPAYWGWTYMGVGDSKKTSVWHLIM